MVTLILMTNQAWLKVWLEIPQRKRLARLRQNTL
jgi:hypothetical protein